MKWRCSLCKFTVSVGKEGLLIFVAVGRFERLVIWAFQSVWHKCACSCTYQGKHTVPCSRKHKCLIGILGIVFGWVDIVCSWLIIGTYWNWGKRSVMDGCGWRLYERPQCSGMGSDLQHNVQNLDQSSDPRMLMLLVHKDGSMVTSCRNTWSKSNHPFPPWLCAFWIKCFACTKWSCVGGSWIQITTYA